LDNLRPQHFRLQPELAFLQVDGDRADNKGYDDDGDGDDDAELEVDLEPEEELNDVTPRRTGRRNRRVTDLGCPPDNNGRGPRVLASAPEEIDNVRHSFPETQDETRDYGLCVTHVR
jgi:hypothetical protein